MERSGLRKLKKLKKVLTEMLGSGKILKSICSFEGTIDTMAQWLSWLERRPVTAEVEGSSPYRVV